MIGIRRARRTDARALSEIAVAAKAHWGYGPAQLAAWRDALRVTPESIRALEVFVAEEGGNPSGFYALAQAPLRWTLEHFWVHPSSMRRGIGRSLLEHAAATARRGGATGILIDADPNARVFYLACGAIEIGSIAAPLEPSEPDRRRPLLLLRVARAGETTDEGR